MSNRDTKFPKKLRDKLRPVLNQGAYQRPGTPGYGGTGAVGRFLEEQCWLRANNSDTADACGWELKTSSGGTVSLFHLNPEPSGSNKAILDACGYIGKSGERQFRNTISGDKLSSQGCRVMQIDSRIELHVPGLNEPAYWNVHDLKVAASRKIGRLVLVDYKNIPGGWHYEKATLFSGFNGDKLISLIVNGIVKVEVDLSISHDHGVKFRITRKNLGLLYDHETDFQ